MQVKIGEKNLSVKKQAARLFEQPESHQGILI